MKTSVIIILLCLAGMASTAQVRQDSTRRHGHKNGYGSLSLVAALNSGNNGLGGALNFGTRPGKRLGVGLGFEMIKFKNVQTNYIPAYLDLRFFLNTQKVETFILLQPGYGFYNYNDDFEDTVTGTSNAIRQKGGFYFSTGVGVKLPARTSPVITLRYASYQFNTTMRGTHFAASAPGTIGSFVLNVGIAF